MLFNRGTSRFALGAGTPPRLLRSTINYDKLVEQPSEKPFKFSHVKEYMIAQNAEENDDDRPPLITCHLTRTNPATHQIVVDNLDNLPSYDVPGGVGPRYCPSLPTKVERFADRDGHNSFLEPEGFDAELVYPNGLR